MNNLFNSRKKIALIIFAGVSLFCMVFLVFSVKKGAPPPAPTPSTLTTASWNTLTPGVSSQQDVINKLGKPKSTNGRTLSFGSQNPNIDNQVFIENGVASFFKEIVSPTEKITSDKITSEYGTAQNVLYGPDSASGFYLFVYPANGVAYLGNPNTKDVIEIWYFKPTTIDDFINKRASGYSQQQQQQSIGY
jgi:hypothetical protein